MTEKRNATIYYGGFAFRGGGAFMHAQLLRTELQRAGWAVELITLESLPLPIRFLPHILAKALNSFISPMGFYYKDRLTRFLFRLFLGRDAQLRIFEDIYLAWNSTVPSATLLHAVWSDNLQSISPSAADVRRLVKAEERVIDSISHPIITVSDKYRDFLVCSHAGSRRLEHIRVVPLGLDLADFGSAGEAQRRTKALVFCGSLEPRKNLRFLLSVFHELHGLDPAYHLTIIGDGPDHGELERYALTHALPVVFRGRLGRYDVVRELCQHSIYVHPSTKESFSFALLEGKIAGLKTVAHEKLEVPMEFIDVPVTSFDPADWLDAIIRAEHSVSKEINVEEYSSRRMMLGTLEVALGSVKDLCDN